MSAAFDRQVDVYLFPTVVGGGLGDVEEVFVAGRRLAAAGYRVLWPCGPETPAVFGGAGAWATEGIDRARTIRPQGRAALVIAPNYGVSTSPGRPGPLGRPGPWAPVAARIRTAYEPGAVLFVSLEEFARTLTSEEEEVERWREGGRTAAAIRHALAAGELDPGARVFHRAFARFRGFDRPDVVHLFGSFFRRSAFVREFPEAILTGPLWPFPSQRPPRRPWPDRPRWAWYASPSSSLRIAAGVREGVGGAAEAARRLAVRSPVPLPGLRPIPLLPAARWRRLWARADVRIATGSRTLLEAIDQGGPFLYYNGLLGRPGRARRHRPEKLRALLAWARALGLPKEARAAWDAFSRGREIVRLVRAIDRGEHPLARLGLLPLRSVGFRPPFDEQGRLLETIARRLSEAPRSVPDLVQALREEGRRPAA